MASNPSPLRWLPLREARLAAFLSVACLLIAAAPKENQKDLAAVPGDTVVIAKDGTELLAGDEVLAKLKRYTELKILEIKGDLLYCRILSGTGGGLGWIRKVDVKNHPWALRRKDGVFRFVLSRTSAVERTALERRDKLAHGDARQLLIEEFSKALRAQKAAVLPDGAVIADFKLLAKRLSKPLAGAVRKMKVVKKHQSLVDKLYTLYAAYLMAEIKHTDIMSAIEGEVEKLAREKSWDAEALKAGVRLAVATLDTAVGGNTIFANGRFH